MLSTEYKEEIMIVLNDVTKKFKKREALKHVSLSFDKGCYGLLGPNGAGKTTLLRCILKLYHINSGTISINDSNSEIGYLPQKFGLFRELKVYDMLLYFAVMKKIPKNQYNAEIERVLTLVNLEDRSQERVSRLSGGMIRRLGIAQAILGNPSILFFDEPTAGLDPEERMRFKELIGDIAKNKIILISTHIVGDVEALCDRIIIMDKGSVLTNETMEELLNDSKDENGIEATLEKAYMTKIRRGDRMMK